MIAIGNSEFVLGMRFCGITDTHIYSNREEILKLIKTLKSGEFIIANASVVEEVPELKRFRNLATLPDNVDAFNNVDDLKYIIKKAIGMDLEVL